MDLTHMLISLLLFFVVFVFLVILNSFKMTILECGKSQGKLPLSEGRRLQAYVFNNIKMSYFSVSVLSSFINLAFVYFFIIAFFGSVQHVFVLLFFFLFQIVLESLSLYLNDRYGLTLLLKNIGLIGFLTRVFSFFLNGVLFFKRADLSLGEVEGEVCPKNFEDGLEEEEVNNAKEEMINNVFEFHDLKLSEVMTHRTDIVSVDINGLSLDSLIELAIQSGHSRIPAYKDGLDDIIGAFYVKDLLGLLNNKGEDFIPKKYMRNVMYVPDTLKCQKLFDEFCVNRIQLAIVVDEYGGTSGIITMEDLIEAIVGDIEDEYDEEEENGFLKLSENEYQAKGSCDLLDFCIQTGLSENVIEEGKSHINTIAGFIIDELGHVPNENDMVEFEKENGIFKISEVEDNRIIKVNIKIVDLKK